MQRKWSDIQDEVAEFAHHDESAAEIALAEAARITAETEAGLIERSVAPGLDTPQEGEDIACVQSGVAMPPEPYPVSPCLEQRRKGRGQRRAVGRAMLASTGEAQHEGLDMKWMVRTFKTGPCERKGSSASHDHQSCTFYHSSRDRRRYVFAPNTGELRYAARPCDQQFDDQRICPRGDSCTSCHSTAELLYHPESYRKRLCHQAKHCARGRLCPFAHTREELLVAHFTEDEEAEPSEDFMAHKFKTQWCPIGGPHNWKNCVYAHSYRDWRRSPKIGYSSSPCPQWAKGIAFGSSESMYEERCPYGMACSMAHGANEQLYHPQVYKTSPCSEVKCKGGPRCAFTHGPQDSRRCQECQTFTFSAGDTGVNCDPETGLVTHVDKGQGQDAGVKAGWRIVEIDSIEYGKAAYDYWQRLMNNGSMPYNITFSHPEATQPNFGPVRWPIAGVEELLAHYQPTYCNPPRYGALEDNPFGNASNKCPSRKNRPFGSRKGRQRQMPKHNNDEPVQSQGDESGMAMWPSAYVLMVDTSGACMYQWAPCAQQQWNPTMNPNVDEEEEQGCSSEVAESGNKASQEMIGVTAEVPNMSAREEEQGSSAEAAAPWNNVPYEIFGVSAWAQIPASCVLDVSLTPADEPQPVECEEKPLLSKAPFNQHSVKPISRREMWVQQFEKKTQKIADGVRTPSSFESPVVSATPSKVSSPRPVESEISSDDTTVGDAARSASASEDTTVGSPAK